MDYRKSEEEEKSLNIEKESLFPISIFFVDIRGLIGFLLTEGFYIDHLSLRFRDKLGQGIKTYYSIPAHVVFNLVNSNQIFDIEEIVFTKFFEKVQVKIKLNSIEIKNGTISLYDGVKRFIRQI